MDSDNSATPPSSLGQKPDTSAGSLYAQITAEDVAPTTQTKKPKASWFIQAAVRMMQVTFFIDSVKRTHESVFIALSALWALFMACIYVGGALVLLFGVVHIMQLPLTIDGLLRERGLEFDKIQLTDYALNRIEVTKLRDKKGQYRAAKMIINSTFADFLRKKIRAITLEELDISVVSQDGHLLLGQLPTILDELQHPARGALGLTVDGININNATVHFNQGQMSLPISFQVVGVYAGKTEVSVHLNIDQPNLTLAGHLINSPDRPSEALRQSC